MKSSMPFPDEVEMKDRSSSPIPARRSGRLAAAANKRATTSAMDNNAITRKRKQTIGRKRKRSPSASESALSSASAVAVAATSTRRSSSTKPRSKTKEATEEKIQEMTLPDLVARLHLEGQKDRPELVPVYPAFMTQSRSKKTTKHLPIRLARQPEAIETRKLDKTVLTVKKFADEAQDTHKIWKRNAKYTFNIECLEHADTKERWLNLKDLLLGFGYGTQNNGQKKARFVYHESLINWLHMNFLEHPIERFVRTFGTAKDEYLSKEGFTMLVSILNSYEGSNNMVKHITKFRFQYMKKFYKYALVKKPREQDHGHDYVCNVCCMEDLKEQFEQICDCNHSTHLRCPDQPEPPKTDEQKGNYFCYYCKNTFPDPILQARRGNRSGEFEVERVLGFSEDNPDIWPNGAYLAIWKFFPLQACEFLRLEKSFAGAVEEFWNVQQGFRHGLVFKKKTERHLKIVQGKIKRSSRKSKASRKPGGGKGKKTSGRRKRTAKSTEATKPFEKDRVQKIFGKLGKVARKMTLHHLKIWQDEEKLDLIDHSIFDVPLGGKRNREVPHLDLREAKEGEKYIPVKLWQVTKPENIIHDQRLTHESAAVKNIKQTEYMAKLVRGRNRATSLLQKKYNGEVPRRCLNGAKEKHFDVFQGDFVEQVNELMTRDWSQWTHDTSHEAVTIGAIIDPANPASKFSDDKVGKHVYGLFAADDIEEGKILMEYVGVCALQETAEKSMDHVLHELDQTTLMDLSGPEVWNGKKENFWDNEDNIMVVDPNMYHNEAIYMNDFRDNVENWKYNWGKKRRTLKFNQIDKDEARQSTRQKNVELVEVIVNGWPHVFCVTMRDIERGEELLTDYGAPYWVNFKQIKERIEMVFGRREKDRNIAEMKMEKELKKVQEKVKTYDDILEYCKENFPEILKACEMEIQAEKEKKKTSVVPTDSEVEKATEDVEMSDAPTAVKPVVVDVDVEDDVLDEEFPVIPFEITAQVDVEMVGC